MPLIDIESQQPELRRRSLALLHADQHALHSRTDKLFANLMLLQWIAGIAAALYFSPQSWEGTTSQIHVHVWTAIFLGGAIAALPVLLARCQPGSAITRHVIAVAQMLTSAFLIHLTGGRIEAHFHIFGSLAFLAIYRDWRVLATATLVTAADHFARGIFWPEAIFGSADVSPWRWIEHVGWVLFEDVFLCISIRQSLREMGQVAARRATLEAVNHRIENQIAERTAELRQEVAVRSRAELALRRVQKEQELILKAVAEGIHWIGLDGRVIFENPAAQRILGYQNGELIGLPVHGSIHPCRKDGSPFGADDCPICAGLRSGEVTHATDETFLHRDGTTFPVEYTSTPVRDETGVLVGSVVVFSDISQRQKAAAELEAAHCELLEASRQAGMAEVATAVLHNVGNVLNSVNITSTCVADRLRRSRTGSLAKVVTMLRDHANDLGGFFAHDPRSRQLPDFLAHLSEQLTSEQSKAISELANLQKNIEHIKEIVSQQQRHAKCPGIAETVQIADLVEDTLRMSAGSFDQHGLKVDRKFEAVPPIKVEKHKVLQILVNLVRNAAHACEESTRPDKTLTLRVSQGLHSINVAVADNGIGIPPENLTRIFNHGFTTKRDGHGFGLHSCALAARAMGGALRVESLGPDQGATFTLELPTTNTTTALR